ncbi:hypothetical protein B0H16DRAFT_1472381 [Mycena metata]|uniref:Uncharacterized protein n=1 Tax=Mycena metata TaxID=1033252 RepID=A0AAD7HN50_9AGAR|nr:hypothetical protein B0H16DRAFT_1472381 [Mycena metata]
MFSLDFQWISRVVEGVIGAGAKMVLVLCDASEVSKDRVSFRNDVHDMLRPLDGGGMTKLSLTCWSPVSSSAVKSSPLTSDTFFAIEGQSTVEDMEVICENDTVRAEVWFVGGRLVPRRRVSSGIGKSPGAAKVTNVSTGPQYPMYWRQSLFLLKHVDRCNVGWAVTRHFHHVKS